MPAARAAPNILIIVIDSMRADHVSCYGYGRQTTPNIDRLAAEGCIFDTCISAAPFSPASYASIFSNLYPHEHGVNGDTVRVWPDRWPRLPQLLRDNGYHTFGVSTNGFVGRATNATPGFDEFDEAFLQPGLVRRYSALIRLFRDRLGWAVPGWLEPNHLRWPEMRASQSVVRRVQRHMAKSPGRFFGFVILMDPHAPYDYRRREFAGRGQDVKRFFKEVNEGKMWAKLMAARSGLNDLDLRIALDLYDAEILHADRCVGRLYDWLTRRGILDDTILVVTSDHGEAFGERGVWGHGFCLDDCLTRVPLVVRCPRYWTAGSRSSALVQLHDLHEMCLSVSMDGQPQVTRYPNCLTQAVDASWRGRKEAFSEFPVQTQTLSMFRSLCPDFVAQEWGSPMWSVRTHDWRYVEFEGDSCALYECTGCEGQSEPVPVENAQVCAELKAALDRHRRHPQNECGPTPEPDREQLDEAVLDRLRALGYIE